MTQGREGSGNLHCKQAFAASLHPIPRSRCFLGPGKFGKQPKLSGAPAAPGFPGRPPKAGKFQAGWRGGAGPGVLSTARVRSPAPGAGPHLRRAGRRLPGNLGLAREAWARAASLGHARDRGTQGGAATGGTGAWARGLRPLTMVKGRFSKFLQKFAFSRAGHQYEPLEGAELDTLVSPGYPARVCGVTPTPSHPVPPQDSVRPLRAARPQLARPP